MPQQKKHVQLHQVIGSATLHCMK